MPDLTQIIVSALIAIPGILALLAQRKKTSAEVTDVLTDAALDIVRELKEQIDSLRFESNEAATIAKLSSGKIRELEKHVAALEGRDQYNQREIAQLRREVEGLRARIRQYRAGIVVLIKQLEKLEQVPDFNLMPGDE